MKYLKHAIISIFILATLTGSAVGLYFLYSVKDWSLYLVILFGILVINTVTSLVVFIQRRNLQAKLSWLLVVNVFPFFGAALFYLFGQRYAAQKSYTKYVSNKFILEDKNMQSSKTYDQLISAQQMTKRGVYKANFNFFKESGEAIQAMFDDMRKAKKFIHLHFYIVKPGEIYEEFKQILIEKARDGVEVRFIVDDFGRWGMPNYQIRELKRSGIEVGIFGAVNFPFIGSENGYRTHRKMIIIDGNIAHLGGLNIANEYASLSKKYGLWVDLQGRITGPFVKSHSLLFLQDWSLVTGNKLSVSSYTSKNESGNCSSVATLVEDSPENNENIIEASLSKMILGAKQEIHISTPYLVPTSVIYSSLKTAALAGIKVHLYIPGKPDKKTVFTVTKYHANKLQEFGVIIHRMNNMLIHSKVGLFDNEYAYFGTCNLDVRSLYSQFEVINIFYGKDVVQITKLFKYYQQVSSIIPNGKFRKNIWWERLMTDIYKLVLTNYVNIV